MNYFITIITLVFLSSWSLVTSAEDAPYVMGSLGDSISAGFNASRYGDNRELSWTGGLDVQGQVQSHARRIKERIGNREIVVYNEAFVSAESSQLARQAARLLRVKPDYVTIAIGANDVCTWYDDYLEKLALYRESVTSVVEKIIRVNPKVKIVLAPIPSLKLMYELGINRPGCSDKWETMEVCKPLLGKDRTPEDREKVYARLAHINQTISEIAAAHSENVRYPQAMADFTFDESIVSQLDCFHPSIKGHNLISEMSFDPSWY